MPTWLTLLFSAGVLGICWNAYARKKDANEARSIRLHDKSHTALTVATKLEDFARRSATTIDDATHALHESYAMFDYKPLRTVKFPPFLFPETIQWRDLDPTEASKLQALVTDIAHSVEKIKGDEYSEPDGHVLDLRRHCARFGQLAWVTAGKLRLESNLQAIDDHGINATFREALDLHEARLERIRVSNERFDAEMRAAEPLPTQQIKQDQLPLGGRDGSAEKVRKTVDLE